MLKQILLVGLGVRFDNSFYNNSDSNYNCNCLLFHCSKTDKFDSYNKITIKEHAYSRAMLTIGDF